MFRHHHKFQKVDKAKSYKQFSNGTMAVRSELPAYVYLQGEEGEETLIGYGSEPFEVQMQPGYFRVASEGDVWIAPNNIDQEMFKVSNEIFTTLDRPAPLSPEMLAIQRMIRQNELDRERMYERVETALRRKDALRDRDTARGEDLSPVAGDPETAVSDEPKRSGSRKAAKKPASKDDPEKAEERAVDDTDDVSAGSGDRKNGSKRKAE